jgi:hypothetical protein
MKRHPSRTRPLLLGGLFVAAFAGGYGLPSSPIGPGTAHAAHSLCVICSWDIWADVYDQCLPATSGGDYCTGSCDEHGECTCRTSGDCDPESE